ncbi:MAG: VC0807 family protein [Silvibacterium sp.]
MEQKTMSPRRVLLGYAVDIFGPLAVYWVTTELGVPVFWALALGIGIAVVSTGINTIKRGKLDAVGVLVLVEMAASVGLLFWLHSPRMLLIRPSFYSGIAAVWLMSSAFAAKPLTLESSKPFATKGDPVRTVAWERAWRELPQFRMAHRMLTFGFGVACAADAVLRVVVVYRYPVDRAAWLSNLPHIGAMVILLIAGAAFGRWAGPLVDKIQREMATNPSANSS